MIRTNRVTSKQHFAHSTLLQHKSLLMIAALLISSFTYSADKEYFNIYLDADQTHNRLSGQSIELGISAAFSEVGWSLGKYSVKLVIKDHRGSTPRSQFHLKEFTKDKRALALFGGMHSPPLIKSRDLINENEILTLVPWAAATPITRPKLEKNWIFRLSIDDSKAGKVIVRDLVTRSHHKAPYLVLEESGWGRANKKTMQESLLKYGGKYIGLHYFKWGIGSLEAKRVLQKAKKHGADSILFVGNSPEGQTFAKAMLSLNKNERLPIYSHWGITGGNFFSNIGSDDIAKLDLTFIQTSFSFFDNPLPGVAKKALKSASVVKRKSSMSPSDIKAPTGFIHAYDLTKLFIAAANKAELTGDARQDRKSIKKQLESLDSPVKGLIKTYVRPFSSYNSSTPDAHEALGEDDFQMAGYNKEGDIRLIE